MQDAFFLPVILITGKSDFFPFYNKGCGANEKRERGS